MTTQQKGSVGWSVAIAMIAVIGTILALGVTSLRHSAIVLDSRLLGIRNQVNNLDKALAVIEANQFTSQDGVPVWQSIASLINKHEAHAIVHQNLPPARTQAEITQNKLDIAKIQAMLGMDDQ